VIRQARTYLTGAVSATALIAAAVIAFVVLVSLQALESWPLAGSPSGEEARRAKQPAAALVAHRAKAGTHGVAAGSPAARRHAAAGNRTRAGIGATSGTGGGSTGSEQSGGPSSNGGSAPSGEATSSGGGSGSASHFAGTPTPVETVTGTASGTVGKVEQTVEETGVTTTTGAAVQQVAGPDSTVSGVSGKLTEAADGLTGAGH
jgi:hypothetical protein